MLAKVSKKEGVRNYNLIKESHDAMMEDLKLLRDTHDDVDCIRDEIENKKK